MGARTLRPRRLQACPLESSVESVCATFHAPGRGTDRDKRAASDGTRALVVRRHHLFVRLSHWFTIPLLIGLILSGLSIYWASPIYQHQPDPQSGNTDYLADAGTWMCAHIPWLRDDGDPAHWVYNHFSLGPFLL